MWAQIQPVLSRRHITYTQPWQWIILCIHAILEFSYILLCNHYQESPSTFCARHAKTWGEVRIKGKLHKRTEGSNNFSCVTELRCLQAVWWFFLFGFCFCEMVKIDVNFLLQIISFLKIFWLEEKGEGLERTRTGRTKWISMFNCAVKEQGERRGKMLRIPF